MITPYGRDNASLMLGAGGCIILLALTPIGTFGSIALITLGIAVVAFTLWFFRDPERYLDEKARNDDSWITAPADGTVTEVIEVDDIPFVGGKGTQISIFLSPLNLHVNRYPATGIILDAMYKPGKYLMAFNPKASEENEQSVIVVLTSAGSVLFRQITGFLARRIVFVTKKGDVVKAGERFGMMKFGSRMDVVVPLGSEIFVRPGNTVISASTIIARLKRSEPTT